MPDQALASPLTTARFLAERTRASPVSIVLAVFYLWSGWPEPTGNWYSFGILVLFLAIQPFRPPRAVSWLVLLAGFTFHLWQVGVVEASLPMFRSSSRDLAVIDSVRALTTGHNPWSFVKSCNVTTGPASILGLTPAVLLTGNLKAITLLFWITIAGIFVVADVVRRSDRAASLTLLLLLDRAAMPHTLHWRLDELYFPMLLLVLAFFALRSRRMSLAGFAIALAPLCRANYAFLTLGLLLWVLWSQRPSRREAVSLFVAAAGTALIVLLPFVFVGGQDFFRINPFTTAMGMSVVPTQTGFARLLAGHISPLASSLVRIGVTVLAVGIVSWFGRKANQPFWIIAFASLVAHTFVWSAGVRRIEADYTFMVLLPVLLGAAFVGISPRSDGALLGVTPPQLR